MPKKKEQKPISKTDTAKKEQPRKTPERDASGRFVKGHPKKGGRAVGSKNKYGNVRDRLKDILMPYLEFDPDEQPLVDGKTPPCFATDLMKIDDPKDRIDAVAKVLPFVVPKYSATTISADTNRPLSDEEQLLELDEKYTKKEISINIKALTIVDNDNLSDDYDPDDDPDFNIDDIK